MGRGEGEKGEGEKVQIKGLKGFKIALAALLIIAVLAVFSQCLGFNYLRFDDPDYTFACAFVKDGLSWPNICEAFRNVRHSAVWMPITWISYMADISLFGRGAVGHHLVNVVLHLANSLILLHLVFSMMLQSRDSSGSRYSRDSSGSRYSRNSSGSMAPSDSRTSRTSSFSSKQNPLKTTLLLVTIAVTFWAIHPQRVEAVAWIASRKELLWAFFTLLGLVAWRGGRSFAALACCALACMSKPTAMVFPLLAMLVGRFERFEKFERFEGGENCDCQMSNAECPKIWKTIGLSRWLTLSAMFAMAIATGILAIYSQTHPEGMAAKDLFYAPLGERLAGAATAIGLYLAQMVVPVGIHLDYRAIPGGWPLHCGLGLTVFAFAVFGVGLWLLWRGSRNPRDSRTSRTSSTSSESIKSKESCDSSTIAIKAILFFIVALLPTLGLFGSFGEHARADRFLYVPAMALPLMVAAWGTRISRLSEAIVKPRNTLNTQNCNFLKSRFLQCIQWLKKYFGGLALLPILLIFSLQSFRITATYHDDASAFARTLSCDPGHGRALAHVGEARCAAGSLDEGIDMLRRSREVRPRDATDGKLAYALMRRGRSADWDEIRTVCAPFAADPMRDVKGQALEALGTAELKAREWAKAAEHLSRSILAPARFYSPNDAKLKLAYAWHNGGRRTEARKLFEAISRSTRTDLSAKADEVLSVLDRSPNAMLFW